MKVEKRESFTFFQTGCSVRLGQPQDSCLYTRPDAQHAERGADDDPDRHRQPDLSKGAGVAGVNLGEQKNAGARGHDHDVA